jgi:hypothetical protein
VPALLDILRSLDEYDRERAAYLKGKNMTEPVHKQGAACKHPAKERTTQSGRQTCLLCEAFRFRQYEIGGRSSWGVWRPKGSK